VSAGLKGGLAGGLAMAILAMLCGALSGRGIWYPINLLSAGFLSTDITWTATDLSGFQGTCFVLAVIIHLIASLVVGLLYAATFPMVSRRFALIAAFAAPMLGSGLLHTVVGIVNPLLDRRIDWFWFAVSQIAFGIVAGIVVSRQVGSGPSPVSGSRERLRSPASSPPRRGTAGR